MKKLFVALMGTVVEYYDYALYGFSAVLISHYFFPQTDPLVQLIQSFGVLALSSWAKPLGAVIYGILGDKRGRKFALRHSMIGIAIPTFIVGILPTYDAWGPWCVVILVLCRITQGIFLGGEYDGVVVYITEHLPQTKRCLGNGLVGMSFSSGIAVASLVVSIAQIDGMPLWAWRVPFILGGLLGLGVLFLRQYLIETPIYLETSKNFTHRIIGFGWIRNYKAPLFASFLMMGTCGGLYYFLMIFWGNYVSAVLGFVPPSTAAFYTSMCLWVYVLASPCIGIIADLKGRGIVLKSAIIGFLILILCYGLMIKFSTLYLGPMILGGMVLSLLVPVQVMCLELFPPLIRYRAMSLSHTVGSLTFSSTTPALCLVLYKYTGSVYAPLYYAFGLLGIFSFGLIIAGRVSQKQLSSPSQLHETPSPSFFEEQKI